MREKREGTIKRIVISILIKQKQRQQQQQVLPFVVALLKRIYFIIYSTANFKVQLTPDS